jgi:hypothetical protein
MIVAETDPKGTIIIGLCEADLEKLRQSLTVIKEGGTPDWSFRNLVVFFGKTDADCIATLNTTKDTKRRDNRFPDARMG